MPDRLDIGFARFYNHLGFDIKPPDAQVAQLVEQRTENPRVGSSILSLGTIFSIG